MNNIWSPLTYRGWIFYVYTVFLNIHKGWVPWHSDLTIFKSIVCNFILKNNMYIFDTDASFFSSISNLQLISSSEMESWIWRLTCVCLNSNLSIPCSTAALLFFVWVSWAYFFYICEWGRTVTIFSLWLHAFVIL